MIIKNRFFLLAIASYLISYLSIFIRFLQHDLIINQNFDTFFFNSDAVFFNNIAKDIILRDGTFSSWMLAGAPEIFPTMFLSYFILLITKNIFISQIIFTIVQSLTFNILLISIINLFTKKKYAILTGVFTNILLVFILFIKPYNFIFIASHHFGCFINFLICFLFINTKSIDKSINFIFLTFLLFLFSFSNPIFIPYFVLPLVIIVQFFSNFKKVTLKNICFLVSAILGYVLKKIVYYHDCVECSNTYQTMDNIRFDSIFIGLYHIKMFFISHSNIIQNMIMLISLTIFLCLFIKLYVKIKAKDYVFSKKLKMIIFLFFSTFFTLLGFLFLDMNPQFRHLYPIYFAPFLMLPVLIYKYIKHIIQNFKNIIILSLLISTIILSVLSFDNTKKVKFEYYPKDIQFIDKVLNKYKLNHGYSKWEHCNRLVFLSKIKLTVLPYHNKKPLHWDTKLNWINKKPQFLINLDPKQFGYKKFKTFKEDNISIHVL